MLAGLVTCRSCYLTRTITTSMKLEANSSVSSLFQQSEVNRPENTMISLTHLTVLQSWPRSQSSFPHGCQPWGSHLGASSRLFLQKSKVRVGTGSDFLWNNPDLLILDPYGLLVPRKDRVWGMLSDDTRKTLQGWSAQISSRTSLGALDKRHLKRPFPPPPSVENLASFSAVGLGEDLFTVALGQLLGCWVQ